MQEALRGEPFVGEAGACLDKCFRYTGIDRSTVCIDNLCRCKPPNDWLDGAPWEFEAIQQCQYNLDKTLEEKHKVVVPLGGTAIRNILGISRKEWKSYKKPMENFHGTIHRDPLDRFWIVPSFHPSFIQRGKQKLISVLMHDLVIAKDIVEKGHTKDPAILKVDPPVEWFLAWVDAVIARAVDTVNSGKPLPWLAADIETPEKQKGGDESELAIDDPSYIITRINFAVDYDLNFALTVPWQGPYITGVKRLMNCEFLRTCFWHANYDRPRLNANGCQVKDPWFDGMDLFHGLQSSLPKGLGFVAPFYSVWGAWKHLSSSNPGLYAAIDALQTIRCIVGIEKDLIKSGQWDTFYRHAHLLDRYALKPAEDVGLRVEKGDAEKGTGLYGFQKVLEAERGKIAKEIAKLIPEKLIPFEGNYKRQPVDKETKEIKSEYFEVKSKITCNKCLACEKVEVTKKHRCKERKVFEAEHKGKSPLLFDEWAISRWCVKGEFNPASPPQVLGYIRYKKHKPGKNKKTKADSADAQTIERLWKRHKDPFYEFLLDLRKIDKIKGTYVDGAIRQMDENGRIHTCFTNNPSTWRMSSQGFNLTNIVTKDKKEDKFGLGEKFRSCVVPQKGCYLVEADFAGIEAVQVGWFAADPQYIRLSKLGMHAFVTTHMPEFPEEVAQRSWDDKKLGEYLSYVKYSPKYKFLYNKSKRATHGTAYGLTAYGLQQSYPELYPKIADAQRVIDLILKDVAPLVYKWQESTKLQAHEQHFLGGDSHPYHYKHWFWNVFNYKRITAAEANMYRARGRAVIQHGNTWYDVSLGDDAKRAIAFFPQSTAGGNIREACLRLFTPGSEYYIGDLFYGKTPFRMPIHDSIVLEVPKSRVDFAIEKLVAAMSLPIKEQPCPPEWGMGEYLTIGVDVELGSDWSKMEKVV